MKRTPRRAREIMTTAALLCAAIAFGAHPIAFAQSDLPAAVSENIRILLDSPHVDPTRFDTFVPAPNETVALLTVAADASSARRQARAIAALAFVPVVTSAFGERAREVVVDDRVQRFLREVIRSSLSKPVNAARAAHAALARAARVDASAPELERVASSPHSGAVEVAIRWAYRTQANASRIAPKWAKGNPNLEALVKRLRNGAKAQRR